MTGQLVKSKTRGQGMSDASIRLIAILRRPSGLAALLNRLRIPSDQANWTPRRGDHPPADWPSLYETFECPVADLVSSVYPTSNRLLASWGHLARVRYLDSETLFHLLVVLLETVPDPLADRNPPARPDLGHPPTPPRATAAHPRAFRGTKDQPAKPKRPTPRDLRPYLCDQKYLIRLLWQMRPHIPAVVQRLTLLGYPRVRLTRLKGTTPRAIGLFASAGLQDPTLQKGVQLPPAFTQHLLPLVNQLTSKEVLEYLSIFRALELERDKPLLLAISRLVSLNNTAATRSWCWIISRQPPKRRAAFAAHLIETQAYTRDPSEMDPNLFDRFTQVTPDARFDHWANRFFAGIRDGVSLEYLLAGFSLADTFNADYKFDKLNDCPNFPYETVRDLVLYLPNDGPNPGHYALAAWERCGQLKGLSEVLRTTRWTALSPETARHYLDVLLRFVYHDVSGEALQRKWRFVMGELPRIEALLGSTLRRYQGRLLTELKGYLWYWDEPEELRRLLPFAYAVSRRLAAPPFRTDLDTSEVLSWFLEITDEAFRRTVLQAPEASLLATEDACRRTNDARLISRGVEALTQLMGGLAANCFVRFPRKLFKTAKVLGSMSHPVRHQLLRELRDHPICAASFESLPTREACLTIHKICAHSSLSPVPRNLRAWAEGVYTLTPARLTRYARLMFEKFDLARLDFIEQRALANLKEGLPVRQATGRARHALQLLGSIAENRRGLRRFLNAHWSGDFDYLERHPAAREWLKRHPQVNVELWTRGIRLRGKIEGNRVVTIGVERDPLEVLRLGTYVGSCLGLGGWCDDSAAAILLDINKQVLYARDERNTVMARQLVAISKDNHLVCFRVYPESAGLKVRALFCAYDAAFARALGLKLYREEDGGARRGKGYEIEGVLSQSWWDDGAWDFVGGKPRAEESRKKVRDASGQTWSLRNNCQVRI